MASVTSTSGRSYNRITGLATGLDTDSMVKQMMKPYQMKVDKAKQARDLISFRQEMYRDIIKDLRGLYSKYTDVSKTDSLLLSKNYGTSKFTSTNEGAVTAEGQSGAVLGNYKVEVQKVATTAKLELSDLSQLKGKKITIDVSGKKVDVELSNTLTDADAIKQLNTAMTSAGVDGKFSTSDLAGKIILQSNKTGTSQYVQISDVTAETAANVQTNYANLENKSVAFKINGTDILVDLTGVTGATNVQQKLNTELSSHGVQVGLNADDIVLTTDKLGDSSSIEVKTGTPLTTLVSNVGTSTRVPTTAKPTGTNAEVKVTDSYGHTTQVGGVDGFVEKETNEFIIDGVKFKITDVTTSPVTLVGSADTTKLVDKIKEFVKDYNDIIGKITTKLTEKKEYKYTPLTNEQKEEMTDEQIEKWETKVKQGLLKRDNDLTNITSSLRAAFYDSIEGTNLNIKALGIDFSNDMSKSGQLEIDETKLSKALVDNSEDVIKLFTATADSTITDKKQKYDNSGIFQRIKTILNDSVMTSSSSFLKRVGYEGTATYSDNDLTDELVRRQKLIDEMESNLATRENQLYAKFGNLETMMNNYNSQSAWISQQFGGA